MTDFSDAIGTGTARAVHQPLAEELSSGIAIECLFKRHNIKGAMRALNARSLYCHQATYHASPCCRHLAELLFKFSFKKRLSK